MSNIPKKRGRPKKVQPDVIERGGHSAYVITLFIGGDRQEGRAIDFLEAFRALPKPSKIVSKAILRVEGNGKTFERLYQPNQLKRLFWPVADEQNAKMLLATIT